jgi:hypothetical protein
MGRHAVRHDESTVARIVGAALGDTGLCVPCLADSTGLDELAVRNVVATVVKAHVAVTVGSCGTCGIRRLVYRNATGRTTY